VKNLLATGYDKEYVEHWAIALGIGHLLAELRDA